MGYIRFVLAAVVLLGHTGGTRHVTTIGSLAAVEAFFFISGFYMAATYSAHYTGEGRNVRFWLSRYTRLFPLYLAILIVMAALWAIAPRLGWALNGTNSFDYFAKPQSIIVHISTWSLMFQDLVSVDAVEELGLPLRQAWSISAELVFYLFVPLLMRFRNLLIPVTMALLIFKALLLSSFGFRYSYFPFISQACYFTLGLAVYRYRAALTFQTRASGLLAPAMIVVILALPVAAFENARLWAHLLLMSILVIVTPTIVAYRESPTSRLLGDASYGVYLVHLLVFDLFLGIVRPPFAIFQSDNLVRDVAIPAFILVASTAIAVLFDLVVQRRIDAWRKATFHDKPESLLDIQAVDDRVNLRAATVARSAEAVARTVR